MHDTLKLLAIMSLVLFVGFGMLSCQSSNGHVFLEKAEIKKIDDSVIYFNGGISEVSYKQFQKFLRKNKDVTFEKMLIFSPGGNTVYGRKIGEYVFDNKLDVEVDTLCFSSCANYIFPAGVNKIIREGSFVGWHGSEHQDVVFADKAGVSVEEFSRQELRKAIATVNGISDSEKSKILEQSVTEFQEGRADEKAFYKKIGVDIYLPIIGFIDEDSPLSDPNYEGDVIAWTYTIDDMTGFNVTNVTYLGDSYEEDVEKIDFKAIFSYDKKNPPADASVSIFIEKNIQNIIEEDPYNLRDSGLF